MRKYNKVNLIFFKFAGDKPKQNKLTPLIVSAIIITIAAAFFSVAKTALLRKDSLVYDIDLKNKTIEEGAILKPGGNPQFCIMFLSGCEKIFSGAAMVCAVLIAWKLPLQYLWEYIVATLIMCALSVVFGKILPTCPAVRRANKTLRTIMPLTNITATWLYPIIYISHLPAVYAVCIIKKYNKKQCTKAIELLIPKFEEQEKRETVEEDYKILKNALDFTNVKLRECIVPRNEIIACEIHDDISVITEKFVESGVSKIPIYKDKIDNIVGYVNVSAMFKNPESIGKVMINVIAVPETMTAEKLLNLFIKSHKSVAIVIDEYGGTAGMLTPEDIIEEITGEIEDEHDVQEFLERSTGNGDYLFSGRLEIDYLNEKYNFNIPESEDYETLAGYIIKLCENIPQSGEEVYDKNFKMKILQVNKTKINVVKFSVNENKTEER